MADWTTEPFKSRYDSVERENIFARHPWLERFPPRKGILNGNSYHLIKRLMDLSIIIVSAPAWLFVLGLCALLIKLEEKGGNVFFYQEDSTAKRVLDPPQNSKSLI